MYVWITLLLAALIAGYGAAFAFGCRMREHTGGPGETETRANARLR